MEEDEDGRRSAMEEEEDSQRNCRSVLITGSNRGIGLGLVKCLAHLEPPPVYLIATCRDPDGAKELKKLAEKCSNIRILKLDVTSEESRKAAVKQVEKLVGEYGLNCLINNAGININATLEQVTSEMLHQNYDTNTVGPLMVSKAFLPLLKRAADQETGMGWHRAAIINISSESASLKLAEENPRYLSAYPYRLSKTALNMVTRSLALELKACGILCISIHPGWLKTSIGGPKAPMTVEDNIPLVVALLGRLGEDDNGSFLDWKGNAVPW